MRSIKNIGVLTTLLLGAQTTLQAQNKLPNGSQTIMREMTSRLADIDSSWSIKHYSLAQRRSLLRLLYQIDQRYRDSLERGSRLPAKQQLFTRKMMANDQANQVLFGKFVESFGWPTQQAYGEQGPLTGWLIVWHAQRDYQERYYPLMKQAYERGLIKASHLELGKRLGY